MKNWAGQLVSPTPNAGNAILAGIGHSKETGGERTYYRPWESTGRGRSQLGVRCRLGEGEVVLPCI